MKTTDLQTLRNINTDNVMRNRVKEDMETLQ
jgi:hypothetical protein